MRFSRDLIARLLLGMLPFWTLPLPGATPTMGRVPKHLAALEARGGGRLGVAALDTGSGRRLAYRGGERFPLCSSFKVLVAAAFDR